MDNVTTVLPCTEGNCGTDATKTALTPELVLGLSLAAFICAVIFTIAIIMYIRKQCRKDDKKVEAIQANVNRIENGFDVSNQTRMKLPPGQNYAFVSKTNSEVILGRKSTYDDGNVQYASRNVNIAAEVDGVHHQHDNHLRMTDIHFTETDSNRGMGDHYNINEGFENDADMRFSNTDSEEVINDIMDAVHSLQNEPNSTWDNSNTKVTVL